VAAEDCCLGRPSRDRREVVLARLSHGLEEDREEVGSLSSLMMVLEEGLMVVDTLLHVAVASCRTMLVEVQEEADMKAAAHSVAVVGS
jgi:hypothetical protein